MNEMTSNQAADPKAPQPFDRRWLALAVIAAAQLMTALDATIVNIARRRRDAPWPSTTTPEPDCRLWGVAVMAENGRLLPRLRDGGKWSAVQLA